MNVPDVLLDAGDLPGVRKLGNRYVVVTAAELLRWLGLEEGADDDG